MSEQELLNRIKELEEENAKLKNKKQKLPKNILGAMSTQKELNFIYPHYDWINKDVKWKRSSIASTEFSHLRRVAMSAVDKVNDGNYFITQKVTELSEQDFELVVNCADEIAKIAAKYKKQYLESVGREDIVKAFRM